MAGKFTINTLITLITRILQLFLGIASSVIIARVLGPKGKGVYSLVILLPTLLITFTNIGISSASIFYIGQKKYDLKEVLGNNIIFALIISIFAILIGLIIVFFFENKLFPNIKTGYLLLSLCLIPFQFFFTFLINILLGLQKIKKYNFISLIRTVVFLFLATILLIIFYFGINGAIIAQVLSFFIAGIILFRQTNNISGGISFCLNKQYFKDSFSYGIKVYLGSMLTFLHLRIDIFLINYFLNPTAVGFYSIAVGISEKLWLISQSAGIILFPKVSSESDKKKLKKFTPLVCRNILFITFISTILFFFVAQWLILFLYSKSFFYSILPFRILLVGTMAVSGSRILANDLSGRGKPIINAYLNAASVTLNIILNIIWIPMWGIKGAAWATSVSYTFVFLSRTIVYSKISGNKIQDIIFIKKSDLKLYKNFIINFKKIIS